MFMVGVFRGYLGGYVGVSPYSYLITVITAFLQISAETPFSRVSLLYLYIYCNYVIIYIGYSIGNAVEDYRVMIEYGWSVGLRYSYCRVI